MAIRLAEISDLAKLKEVFAKIVKTMNKNGIFIWHKYYPYEEFESGIEQKCLYVMTENGEIVSAFILRDSMDGSKCFEWENRDAKVKYISCFGVDSNHLHKGIGSLTLCKAMEIARQFGAEFLRLGVAMENAPAINLYRKNGFTKVGGVFQIYSDFLAKNIIENGYEIKL